MKQKHILEFQDPLGVWVHLWETWIWEDLVEFMVGIPPHFKYRISIVPVYYD